MLVNNDQLIFFLSKFSKFSYSFVVFRYFEKSSILKTFQSSLNAILELNGAKTPEEVGRLIKLTETEVFEYDLCVFVSIQLQPNYAIALHNHQSYMIYMITSPKYIRISDRVLVSKIFQGQKIDIWMLKDET